MVQKRNRCTGFRRRQSLSEGIDGVTNTFDFQTILLVISSAILSKVVRILWPSLPLRAAYAIPFPAVRPTLARSETQSSYGNSNGMPAFSTAFSRPAQLLRLFRKRSPAIL